MLMCQKKIHFLGQNIYFTVHWHLMPGGQTKSIQAQEGA